MTNAHPDPESAADALRQAIPRLSRMLERELARAGNPLSLRQLRVLQRVHESDVIAAEIARQSSVGPAAMQGVLDVLVDRGLVLRERSKADRRKQLLTVTPAGEAALAGGNEVMLGVITALTRDLKPAEQEKIATALGALDRAIDRRIAAARTQQNGHAPTGT